jgi:hypothetical protein
VLFRSHIHASSVRSGPADITGTTNIATEHQENVKPPFRSRHSYGSLASLRPHAHMAPSLRCVRTP